MNISILVLLFSHLMADFTFQTNRIAAKKAESYLGVFQHCIVVFAVSIVCMSPWGWRGILYAVAQTLVHFCVDCHKLEYSRRKSPKPFEHFYYDQGLHMLSLFALILLFKLQHFPVPAIYNHAYTEEALRWINSVIVIYGANTIAGALLDVHVARDGSVASFRFRDRFKNGHLGMMVFLALQTAVIGGAISWLAYVAGAILMSAAIYFIIRSSAGNKRVITSRILFHTFWAIALVVLMFMVF